MPQEFLDEPDIDTLLEQVRRVGVAEHVRRHVARDACPLRRVLHDQLNGLHGVHATTPSEEIAFPVRDQLDEFRREVEEAVLRSFPSFDDAMSALRKEILVLQFPDLGETQARRVQEGDKQLVLLVRRAINHRFDFLPREELGELLRFFHTGDIDEQLLSENKHIECLQRIMRQIDRSGRMTPISKAKEPRLDIRFLGITRLFVKPAKESADMIAIDLLRSRTIIPERELALESGQQPLINHEEKEIESLFIPYGQMSSAIDEKTGNLPTIYSKP